MTISDPIPAGVIIWTESTRFEAMSRFYEKTLAMIPANRRHNHIAFEHGEFRLTIGVHAGIAGKANDPLRIMVNLAVLDVDSTFERLLDAGVPIIRAPETEAWGGRISTFSDPDGNTVQMLQLPKESV